MFCGRNFVRRNVGDIGGSVKKKLLSPSVVWARIKHDRKIRREYIDQVDQERRLWRCRVLKKGVVR